MGDATATQLPTQSTAASEIAGFAAAVGISDIGGGDKAVVADAPNTGERISMDAFRGVNRVSNVTGVADESGAGAAGGPNAIGVALKYTTNGGCSPGPTTTPGCNQDVHVEGSVDAFTVHSHQATVSTVATTAASIGSSSILRVAESMPPAEGDVRCLERTFTGPPHSQPALTAGPSITLSYGISVAGEILEPFNPAQDSAVASNLPEATVPRVLHHEECQQLEGAVYMGGGMSSGHRRSLDRAALGAAERNESSAGKHREAEDQVGVDVDLVQSGLSVQGAQGTGEVATRFGGSMQGSGLEGSGGGCDANQVGVHPSLPAELTEARSFALDECDEKRPAVGSGGGTAEGVCTSIDEVERLESESVVDGAGEAGGSFTACVGMGLEDARVLNVPDGVCDTGGEVHGFALELGPGPSEVSEHSSEEEPEGGISMAYPDKKAERLEPECQHDGNKNDLPSALKEASALEIEGDSVRLEKEWSTRWAREGDEEGESETTDSVSGALQFQGSRTGEFCTASKSQSEAREGEMIGNAVSDDGAVEQQSLSAHMPASGSIAPEDKADNGVMEQMASESLAAIATTAPADHPSRQGRAAAVSGPGASSKLAAARKPVLPQTAAAHAAGTTRQPARGLKAIPKPCSIGSAQAAVITSSPGPVDIRGTAPPVAGKSALFREAAVGTTGTAHSGPMKVTRSQHPADVVHPTQEPHSCAKTKTYTQLYSGRSHDGPSGGRRVRKSDAVAAAARSSSSQVDVVTETLAETIGGASGTESSPKEPDAMPSSKRNGGLINRAQGDGPSILQRCIPWSDSEDELGLIAQVEAEAVQLGLEIYARAAEDGVGCKESAHDATTLVCEEEESLEAIMDMGRRPSEIAELLLGGLPTTAVGFDDNAVVTDEEAMHHRKLEEKERKRALRREQKRQQRQRRRILMGLDPCGQVGDSGPESSCSSSSSSSVPSSYYSSSASSNTRKRHQSGRKDIGTGGEIRTIDSRAMMMLSATAGKAGDDMELFGRNMGVVDAPTHWQGQDNDIAADGRIITSAGVATASGLGLLLAPMEDMEALSARRGEVCPDLDTSEFGPNYLLHTPAPELRPSDGMAFQPRPGSDYAPSLVPTIETSDYSSTLPRTAENSEPLPSAVEAPFSAGCWENGLDGKNSVQGEVGAAGAGNTYDDHDLFLAVRDERSRKIAEQLAALQEESRLLQQQSMLLQERTREISRSVGLTTPPQFTSAAMCTIMRKPSAEGRPPLSDFRYLPMSPSRITASGVLLPQQQCMRSPAEVTSTVASGLADHDPYASGNDQDAVDASPQGPQQAPISWALPNRNVMPKSCQGQVMAAAAVPRALPSPSKKVRQLPPAHAHLQAEMQRTGSSSSLSDSLLPRWAEQVESPVMTPEDRHVNLQQQRGVPPITWCPPDNTVLRRVDLVPAKGPPESSIKSRGQHMRIPLPVAPKAVAGCGQGFVQAKSRLGAPAATVNPVAEEFSHGDSQAKAVTAPKPNQKQLDQLQAPLEMSPLVPSVAIPQLAGIVQPPVVLADWPLARGLGLPQAQMPQPPLPGMPLAPVSAVLQSFPRIVAPPAAPAAATSPNPVKGPAPAPKQVGANKTATRAMKPPKALSSMDNNGIPGARKGAAIDTVSGDGAVRDHSYSSQEGGFGAGSPVWMQMPIPEIAMGLPPGIVPMLMQPPFGPLEQLAPVVPMDPWLSLAQAVPHPVAGSRVRNLNGSGLMPAVVPNGNSNSTGHGPNQGQLPANHVVNTSETMVPHGQAYLITSPYGIEGLMSMSSKPAMTSSNPGLPSGLLAPWMPGNANGGDGSKSGISGSWSGFQQLPAQGGVLPPVKLKAGKGKMSRSAPPGSYLTAGISAPTNEPSRLAAQGHMTAIEDLRLGLPVTAWPAPATSQPINSMPDSPVPHQQYTFGASDAPLSGGPIPNAIAMMERAKDIQQQQVERYRAVESHVVNKLDRQQHGGPGEKTRDRGRNSHDQRPVFRLF